MRDTTIARNYAEALLVLARKAEDPEGWGKMLADFATAMNSDITLRRFMESPNVEVHQKQEIIRKALQDRTPRLMVRFLEQLVKNRRQMLIPEISTEYFNLADELEGRVHADVTLATAPSDDDTSRIAANLSRTMGKTVVPHVRIDPAIIGGVIVRIGDNVMDGSVRKRLATLKRRMLG